VLQDTDDQTKDDQNICMKGIIRFLPYAPGSKSESVRPFLEAAGEEPVRLHLEGDNPFSNDGLREFEGRECKVEGEMDEQGDFLRVRNVETTPKPTED